MVYQESQVVKERGYFSCNGLVTLGLQGDEQGEE